MKKNIVIVLLLCMAFSLSAFDLDSPLASKMKLTEAQKEIISEIIKNTDLRRVDINASKEKQEIEFYSLVSKIDSSKDAIINLATQISESEKNLKLLEIEKLVSIRNHLEPEQKKIFVSVFKTLGKPVKAENIKSMRNFNPKFLNKENDPNDSNTDQEPIKEK